MANRYYTIGGKLVLSGGKSLFTFYEVPPPKLFMISASRDLSNGYSLSIRDDKIVWSWGYNVYGSLGDNTSVSKRTPVRVCGGKTFCKIGSGNFQSLSIDSLGRAWSWGRNNNGQLGDNTTVQRLTPIRVCGNKTFCEISAGDKFSVAIDYLGKAWGWGYNTYGQLGDKTNTQRNTPVRVCGGKTFCRISAGSGSASGHCLAIDKDGKAWGWGYGYWGQLGNNTQFYGACKVSPVRVCGGQTFCQISAGFLFSTGIDKNGKGWSWGIGESLGNNDNQSKATPVAICGGKTFCKISCGFIHALAIDKNGKVWTWGRNVNGQLGDNTTTPRSTPVAVAGSLKTFCHISAGGYFCLAIDYQGKAWGWGINVNGQLGDNTTTSRLTPVRVCNI